MSQVSDGEKRSEKFHKGSRPAIDKILQSLEELFLIILNLIVGQKLERSRLGFEKLYSIFQKCRIAVFMKILKPKNLCVFCGTFL